MSRESHKAKERAKKIAAMSKEDAEAYLDAEKTGAPKKGGADSLHGIVKRRQPPFKMMVGSEQYQPPGIEWTDLQTGRKEMLCTSGIWADWILYKHPDGQWVSLQKVTPEQRDAIIAKFNKPRAANEKS